MNENTEYIYVPKVDINEGFNTGEITKAAMFLTKKFIFIVPLDSIGVKGNVTTKTKYTETKEYLNDLQTRIKSLSVEEFEQEMKEKLDMKRIFEIKKLEKLNVQVGFWIFGGMKMRKHGESLKSINVQPKRKRAEIRKFYNLTS